MVLYKRYPLVGVIIPVIELVAFLPFNCTVIMTVLLHNYRLSLGL
jgi:hypothetical protein